MELVLPRTRSYSSTGLVPYGHLSCRELYELVLGKTQFHDIEFLEKIHLFLDAGLKSRFLNMLSFNGGVGGTPDATRNPEEPIPPDISLCLDHLWTEPISRKPRESAAKKVFLSRLVL